MRAVWNHVIKGEAAYGKLPDHQRGSKGFKDQPRGDLQSQMTPEKRRGQERGHTRERICKTLEAYETGSSSQRKRRNAADAKESNDCGWD